MVTARSPRPLSPAQRDVLQASGDGRVTRSAYSPVRWYADFTGGLRGGTAVSATVEALIRIGLLETGPFVALGTPRLALLTDAGRRALEQITATTETTPRDR
jgi:hypothetical protein